LCRWLVYNKWIKTLNGQRANDNVQYAYEPTGSSDGKAKLLAGSVHFAGSDSALSAKEKLAIPNAWFVPVLAGGVAVGFNVPGIGSEELRIPRQALADVFLGRIWQWSGLAPWNPTLAGVEQNISLVVRSEGSGTTSVFTSALSSFSAEWKASVGSSSLPKWPTAASKREGNSGVALGIRLTPYSLGYLNLAEAKTYEVSFAKVANAEGQYIAPTLASVQAGTAGGLPKIEELVKNGSTDFYVDLVDPKGVAEAYPISTFTYLAFNPTASDCFTLFDVMYLTYWAWTDDKATEISVQHQLAPIPIALRSALRTAFSSIKCYEAPFTKFRNNVLSRIEYVYKPVIIGAGATFP
jgi:phosphate ABC transporter phosphate-binding protein